MGLAALECAYPWPSRARETRLRQLAGVAGLAVTGGSDSHDPGPPQRAVGARTVTREELARIRAMASANVLSSPQRGGERIAQGESPG